MSIDRFLNAAEQTGRTPVDSAEQRSSKAAPGRTAPSRPEGARRPPRRRGRRRLAALHRWLVAMVGVLLVTQTTAGASLLYAPEYFHATNRSLFQHTASAHPLPIGDAIGIVAKAHPEFHAGVVKYDNEIYEVASRDKLNPYVYGVDPGTGEITGKANLNGGLAGLVFNLHTCGLTCEGYPGYLPVLNHKVPTFGMRWLDDVTVANVWLGTLAFTLLFLALSGIVLWWPRLRRLASGFRVRWSKSRYARHVDVHRLIGVIAIPMLLVWAITGSSFEFHFVSTAWYNLTGGKHNVEHPAHFASLTAKAGTPDITPDAAAMTATRLVPGMVTSVALPAGAKPTAFYTIKIAAGHDPWRHSLKRGQVTVGVDRHDATHAKVLVAARGATTSNTIWDRWRAPVFHYGYAVSGWWRLCWLALGLSPLVLALTGVSTWLRRRATQRRRRKLA